MLIEGDAIQLSLATPEVRTLDADFADQIMGYSIGSTPENQGLDAEAASFFTRLATARKSQDPTHWRALLAPPANGPGGVSRHDFLPGELSADAHPGRFYVPPGDLPPLASDGGMQVTLSNRARTRFVLREIGEGMDDVGATDGLWLHMAMSVELAGQDDPLASIRVFCGNSDEFTLLRFRDGGMVFLQEIRATLPSGGQPFLISIGVKDGMATIFCDGMPRHRLPCPLHSITGFVVDIASQSERVSRARFHAISLQRGGDRPFWLTGQDETHLANAMRLAALSKSRNEQWRVLHALAGFPGELPADALAEPLNANRRSEPFLPQLEALLTTRREPEATGGALEAMPKPLVSVRNAVVTLASNPGDHSVWPFGNARGTAMRRVVDGISFDAFKGDIIGILGRNGAGKSTFLKTIVGAMPLSEGRIEISGKAVLLRPGAGMQPTLTGRQNIMKCGLHMNLHPKEIEAKIPEIAAFAELEDHLDRPFKYYSDGMRSRLIFSIATAMPYDILLLDELLSAGDIGFQKRVTQRLDQLIERAKLLFVVQHTFDFVVSRCTKCLVMDEGRPVFFGDPQIAAELYREKVN